MKVANDGIFWIAMADFDLFFYMVAVCYYRNDYDDTTICDEHELGGFGMMKFEYKPSAQSANTPITFTLDQANWRFFDKTEDGCDYECANMFLMITQLCEEKLPDGKKKVTQKYIDGTSSANTCTLSKPLKTGLPAGTYLILYCAEWAVQHKMRKLVVSIYDENPLSVKKISSKEYGRDNFDAMVYCLNASPDDGEKDAAL